MKLVNIRAFPAAYLGRPLSIQPHYYVLWLLYCHQIHPAIFVASAHFYWVAIDDVRHRQRHPAHRRSFRTPPIFFSFLLFSCLFPFARLPSNNALVTTPWLSRTLKLFRQYPSSLSLSLLLFLVEMLVCILRSLL